MRDLVKEELNYLRGYRNFIFGLLVTLEILGLLLEDVSGLFVAAYFIFPALMLDKEVKQCGKDFELRRVFIKMLLMYFLVIPTYVYSHVVLYRSIGFKITDVFITNSVTLIISTIFYSMKVIFLKKYGVKEAGKKSLKVVMIIVVCIFILIVVHLIYKGAITGWKFEAKKHVDAMSNKGPIIYLISLAIISLTYILSNRHYSDVEM